MPLSSPASAGSHSPRQRSELFGNFRVLPGVVLEQMRLYLLVAVGTDLEDELPFLARAELALMPGHRPHRARRSAPRLRAAPRRPTAPDSQPLHGFPCGRATASEQGPEAFDQPYRTCSCHMIHCQTTPFDSIHSLSMPALGDNRWISSDLPSCEYGRIRNVNEAIQVVTWIT